jgi:post-segregation antitoxin (ccd killing protein)
MPPELAELLRDNEQARRACTAALQAAFQAGQDVGWTKGYGEGRAVTAALAHRSGCNLNHPAGEPCEVPSDVGLPLAGPSIGLMTAVEQARQLLARPIREP